MQYPELRSDQRQQLSTLTTALCIGLLVAGGAWAEPFVYIGDAELDQVSIVDATDNQVVATLPVGESPSGMAASPDGRTVVVSGRASGTLSVIDTETHQVTETIAVGGSPGALAFSPDGSVLYLFQLESGDLEMRNGETLELLSSAMVVPFATDIAVSPAGDRLYLPTDNFTGQFHVVDAASLEITETVQLDYGQFDAAVSSDGAQVFVAAVGKAYSIDTETFAVTPILEDDDIDLFRGVAFDDLRNRIYVTFLEDPVELNVLDAATLLPLPSIPVAGGAPHRLAITPDRDRLYTTNSSDDSFSVIDLETQSELGTFPLGELPTVIVIPPPRAPVPPITEVPALDDLGIVVLAVLLGILGAATLAARRG